MKMEHKIYRSDIPRIIKGIFPFLISVNIFALLGYIAFNAFDWGLTVRDTEYVLVSFLFVNFICGVTLIALNFKELKTLFKPIKKNTLITLVLILFVASYLRIAVVPHTPRIYFDEDLYIGIAHVIATQGKTELCNYGTPTECREGILNKEPNAYPFFVALLYAVLWSSNPLVFHLFTFFGIISVLLIFLAVYLLTENESTALYSALFLALLPSHIVWTGSISVELFFVVFSLLSLIFLAAYIRVGTFKMLALSTVWLAFTAQSRPESSLFIIVCFLAVLLYKKNILRELASFRFWIPWLILAILLTPHVAHLKNAEETDDWGAGGREKKFSQDVAKRQWNEMSQYWFAGVMFPQAFTLFAAIGVIYGILFDRRILFLALVWFGLFFGLFTFFYAGGVLSGGIGTRFANIYSIPVVIIAAFGLSKVTGMLSKKAGHRDLMFLIVAVISVYSMQTAWDYITVPDKQAQYARDMHGFVYEHMDEIPKQCFVLTHNPSIFLINEIGSLQTWYGTNDKVMDTVFAESGDCVYWLEGAWCLFPPHKGGVCQSMKNRYDLEVVHQLIREENAEQVFTIYRVRRKG
ncbi:MAG: hypothetical protein ABH950_00015 [Candidatus Altiarchaeota archaeon]